jgi:hypothetical protein
LRSLVDVDATPGLASIMSMRDQVFGASAAGAIGFIGFLAFDVCIGFLAGFLAGFIGFFISVPAAGAVVSVLVWASAGLSISAELTPSAKSSFFKRILRIAAKDFSVLGAYLMSNLT